MEVIVAYFKTQYWNIPVGKQRKSVQNIRNPSRDSNWSLPNVKYDYVRVSVIIINY
jgi:hypothetical protein